MPPTANRPAPAGCLWIEDAAAALGVEKSTLYKWRYRRIGPASFKHAGKVVYRETAIAAYLADCEAADSRSNPALNPVLKTPAPRLGSRRPVAA